MLESLYEHLTWADAQTITSIRGMPASSERQRATALYAHLAAAEHVWLARIEDRPPSHPIWPELELDASVALARSSAAGLRAIAGDPKQHDRIIEYRNSTGRQFHNSIAEILLHVAMHGSYHRGQIALLARQGGGVPALTDYIAFTREHRERPHKSEST